MAVLELDRVTKEFGVGRLAVRALDEVSLSVGEGELVIVMGPSGSGKTTMLQTMGALMTPTSGEVRIGGRRVGDRSPGELARIRLTDIGFMFQSFNLLGSLNAVENVALPAALIGAGKRERQDRARRLLERLGLGHRLGHLPQELSGGEKQRVAIARALVNDPPLLLADEPTANLDSASGYQVLHLLQAIAAEADKTVVMVTHDHRITDVATRVLWLADGKLRDREHSFETASDPVCGMEILVDRAAGRRRGRGHVYVFCSQRCLEEFDTDPLKYMVRASRQGAGPAPSSGHGARTGSRAG